MNAFTQVQMTSQKQVSSFLCPGNKMSPGEHCHSRKKKQYGINKGKQPPDVPTQLMFTSEYPEVLTAALARPLLSWGFENTSCT